MLRAHPRSSRRVLPELLAAAWRFRGRVVAAILLLVLAKIATVAVPLALKRIVDEMSRPEEVLALPLLLLVAYALLRFASTFFAELRDVIFSRVTQRTVADFAERAFAHLQKLGPRFHARRRTGALLRDIDRGTQGIAFLMGIGLFTIIPTLVEIALVLVVMLGRYSGWFAVIILLAFAVYSGYTLAVTDRRAVFQRRVNQLDSNARGRLAETLLNYDAVKYFVAEPAEAARFNGIMEGWTQAAVANQKALFVLHVGQSAIIAVAVAAVMLLAGQGVVDNSMTVGDLVLINAYVIQVCLPLNALGFVYREARDALTNTENLLDVLVEKPEIIDPPDLPPLVVRRGEVVFSQVSFGYEPGRRILSEFDLRIPPGRSVAVVGGSGSGKSTLARLLLRFYEVDAGRIAIDGQDIRGVSQESLRRAIGIVPQDTALFNDTIAYNIAYGRPDAAFEEIVAAARAAHLHEFIESLPQRYQTLVGERGVMLSGGERQRIAIARTILKDPPILIFDEATSALDSQAERAIQDEIERMSRDRTTLVIAHRLSTIVGADEIVVLKRGRIIERGSHAALLLRGGVYAQMWLLQQRSRKLERDQGAPEAAA